MNSQLQGKLPEELLQSKDINLLRSIREWADTQVQSLKKEKEQKELDKYRPDIEGKFIKKIHRSWNGPVTVPNPNDFEIAYIKKIDFVGHGFVRCKAVVISIEYSGIEQQLDAMERKIHPNLRSPLMIPLIFKCRLAFFFL